MTPAGAPPGGGVPELMRAAVFTRARTIEVRDVPVPEPGPGEVRLRVRYCGICGSDLTVYRTGALSGPTTVLGHEISAVVDLDPSDRLAPGTRVVPHPARGCGRCLWCREGHPRYCLEPHNPAFGGFAEYTCYPAENLLPVPDDLDDRRAALTEPLGVALRAVWQADPRPGDVAYVSGLGSIGLLVVAGLVASGCRVLGGDPREERRALGLELGCEAVLDPTVQDPFATALALDPHGPPLAFECAGVPESLQQIFDTCGPGGTVGILGVPTGPVLLLRMTVREQRAFSIAGPSMESMRGAMELLRRRPEVARVATGTVPLEGTGEALEALVAGHGGVKVLVAPDG